MKQPSLLSTGSSHHWFSCLQN